MPAWIIFEYNFLISSFVLFVDPESSQAGRVSYEQLDTGKYNRIVKKSKK